MEIEREVVARVVKTTDIEVHVTRLSTELGEYTEIREYVVSLEQYGRGITFPGWMPEIRDTIIHGLQSLPEVPEGAPAKKAGEPVAQ